MMNSQKVIFPSPGGRGLRGGGRKLTEDINYFTPTLTLPHQGGGNFGLFTKSSKITSKGEGHCSKSGSF
jgi:hypothetical protein